MGTPYFLMADREYSQEYLKTKEFESKIEIKLRNLIEEEGTNHFINFLCSEFDLRVGTKILELRSSYPDKEIKLESFLHYALYEQISQDMREVLYDIVCKCDKLRFLVFPYK